MKTNFKRLLSILLCVMLCAGLLQTAVLTADAASTYDATITIHYPRPNEKPSSDFKISSNLNYEFVGYAWSDNNSSLSLGPDTFRKFYLTTDGISEGSYSELKSFTDTMKYNLTILYKLRNTTVPMGIECNLKIVADGVEVDTEGGIVPVSMLKNTMPEGYSIPTDLFTEKDSLLMVSADGIICSPADHIHENGDKACDKSSHWKECAVCGEKMLSTVSKHKGYYTTSYEQKYRETKTPTQTEDGLWEYQCADCGYAISSITVPKKAEQIKVNTYDELKQALAKGGKQWIILTNILSQNDANHDNNLVVDDPNADITIDMNGQRIFRETLYDKSMFDVKAGTLKVIQKDMGSINIGGNSLFADLGFFSGSSDSSVFRVEQGAKLEVMNIAPYARSSEYLYGRPTFVSYGDLTIHSGEYESYVDDNPIVVSRGGDLVINGGRFNSTFAPCVEVKEPEAFTSTLTINGGTFEDAYTTINISAKNAKVVINDGKFLYENKTYGWTTDYGLCSNAKEITINGGTFHGSKSGAYIKAPKVMNINGGYFKNTSSPDQYNRGALQCDIDVNTVNPSYTISGGEFVGKYGIRIFNNSNSNYGNAKFIPNQYIPVYSSVTVDDKQIDLSKEVTYLGTEYVYIKNNTPKLEILSQPTKSSCKAGGTASLSVSATGVKSYLWQYYNGGMWYDLNDQLVSMLTGIKISGNQSPCLSLSLNGNSAEIFRCKLTGYDGTVVYTNSAAMVFGGKPTIEKFYDINLTEGENGYISVVGTNIEEASWTFMISGKLYSLNEIKAKFPETYFTEKVNASGTYAIIRIINVPKGLNNARYAVTLKNSLGNVSTEFARIFVNAPLPEFILGDVDGDGVVKVNDVTMLQKALADIIELDEAGTLAADVNKDGKVDVNDVTLIQKYIAQIISSFD